MLKKLVYSLQYLGKPPWDTGISPPELESFIKNHRPGKALDLGCGTGTNVITLAQHGWQVIGVDFISSAIAQARRKALQAGVQVDLRVGDVTRLNGISGPFDLILDIGCFHNLKDQDKKAYIANLDNLLAPGGSFLLYGFLRNGTDSVINEVDLNELSARFSLVSRQDSTERGRWPSTWLTFTREMKV